MRQNITAVIDNEIHRIEIKNGILIGKYHDNLEYIDLKVAKKLVKDRKAIAQGKSYPVFVDVSKSVSMNKPARDFFASPEGTKGLLAVGVFVKNFLQKSVANFWYTISKPKVPTKLFNDKESALKWLEQFK